MSESQVRGITLYHDNVPVIILNTKDNYSARLFSLLHEVYHIIRHESIASGYQYYNDLSLMHHFNRDDIEVERACDEFAASFIMPVEDIFPLIKDLYKSEEDLLASVMDDSIFMICRKFHCSRSALLFRLRDIGALRNDVAQRKYKELCSRELFISTSGGNYYNNIIAWYGKRYVNGVMSSLNSNKIDISTTCSLLSIKTKALDKLEQVAMK